MAIYEVCFSPPERIDKLNQIGMIRENRYEIRWENMYQTAEKFYKEHGHLKIPVKYVTENGIQLGRWIYRQSEHRDELPEEKIARLDAIGMTWANGWDARYGRVRSFLRENPNYVLSQSAKIGNFWVGTPEPRRTLRWLQA